MFNYPNKKGNFIQKTKYSNRGMELEEDINFANKYYLNNDIAVIHKKPIPIQIVEVKERKTLEKVDTEVADVLAKVEAFYK